MALFPTTANRIIGLDILRSIAILSVVYMHGSQYSGNSEQYFSQWPIAVDGVTIFFVLSGFLIGGILIRQLDNNFHSAADFRSFWLRRWFRTLPNYFLVLGLLIAYRAVVLDDLWDFSGLYFIFCQNLFWPHPNFFPEAWSLSVEEWFYFIFPLIIFILIKLKLSWRKALVVTALGFVILPLVLRSYKFEFISWEGSFDEEFRKIVFLRMDSLMLGVIAAYWQFKDDKSWLGNAYLMMILGFTLLIALYFNPYNWKNFYRPTYFMIESLTAFLFLPILSTLRSTGRTGLDRAIAFLSSISYSMYLLHLTVIQGLIIPTLKFKLGVEEVTHVDFQWLEWLAYLAFTIGLSTLQYHWFESPIMRLRERWVPGHLK